MSATASGASDVLLFVLWRQLDSYTTGTSDEKELRHSVEHIGDFTHTFNRVFPGLGLLTCLARADAFSGPGVPKQQF